MNVTITDVVLRDGLQDEPRIVRTTDKVAIARALTEAGISTIEAVSFVSPKRVPQMADAPEFASQLPFGDPRVRFSALALNAKGIDNAVAAGFQTIHIAVSAGAGHSQANVGRSTESALDQLGEATRAHPGIEFIAGISTAFNCPFDGEVDPARLVDITSRLVDLGILRVGLADTLGTASTRQVSASLEAVRSAHPSIELGLHLHNAHGQALDTAVAAAKDGIQRFDSALGGYGGCPFAPGAHGNVATEELVDTFHAHGIQTGIDPEGLTRARAILHEALQQGQKIAVDA